MFTLRRLLLAATAALVLAVPSIADAAVRAPLAGASTGSQARLVPVATVSLSQGFRWVDAGIGAAVVLALVAVGVAAVLLIRSRVHPPLTR
jgi:hypothetical protein